MFEEISQKQALPVELFKKSLEKNQLSRAYLLTGLAAADKTSFIKELNQILNCKLNSGLFETAASKPKTEDSLFAGLGGEAMGSASLETKLSFQAACKECQNCKWIEADEHPRTPLYLRATVGTRNTGVIPIDDAKELQQDLIQHSEYYRVVVIEDASLSCLHKATANCLLKTIEEANPKTIFILLAESRDTVLPTITSRCQTVKFNNNEELEFSEKAQVLLEELKNSINSGILSSRLEQLIEAEKLAENETKELVDMLSLMQNEISERISADFIKQPELIISIENAIKDLKSFVRPKAVLGSLLREF